MKKTIIWALAFVMMAAFVLLLWTQVAYISNAHKMRDEQFNRLSKAALERAAETIEFEELKNYLVEHLVEDSVNGGYELRTETGESVSLVYTPDVLAPTVVACGRIFSHPSVALSFPRIGADIAKADCYPWQPTTSHSVALPSAAVTRRQRILISKYMHQRKQVDELILRSLMQANSSFRRKLQTVTTEEISRYIRFELQEVGISTPFYYKLYCANGVLVVNSDFVGQYKKIKANDQNTIRQYLFAVGDQTNDRTAYFDVIFPEKDQYVSSYDFVLPIGVSFLVIVLLAIWALRVLFRQQRFAESKTDFINNMTHELKTPVSSISLAGQMLRDRSIMHNEEAVERLVSVLNSESKRLSMLIDKVLQFSLFENKRIRLKVREVDANEVLLNVAEIYTFKTQQTGGDLTLDLEAENTWVMVDEVHFTNALFNLLENAVKYRREKIPLHLTLKTYNLANKLVLEIKDNGIGIPKESLQMVFEKFYRVPTGNRQNVRGFGLGLAYVRKVIQEMKGSIRAESQIGEGTRMIVELPNI